MFRGLLKKQFLELNSAYVLDRKTGKRRSTEKIILYVGLMVIAFLSVMIMFYGMAVTLGMATLGKDEWLYCALMGIMAIFLGVFGSVFNTYAGLFLSKDNELLLALPIPVKYILGVRMIGVLTMSLLYTMIAWIPATFRMWQVTGFSFGKILFFLWSLLAIAVLVTVLTCAVGWLVALIARRGRGKNVITIIASLIFFGVYYYVCLRLNSLLTLIAANSQKLGEMIHGWIYPIYLLGKGATGNLSDMILFSMMVLVAFGITYFAMTKSFYKIATTKTSSKVKAYKERSVKASGMDKALFRKELRRFLSSPTYMLNAGLGIVILPVLAIMVVIKKDTLLSMLKMLSTFIPESEGFIVLVLIAAVGMIVSMNVISTPSISLEGKSLWILQSMPVSPKKILRAKERLHVWLNVVPAVVSMVIVGQVLKLDIMILTGAIAIIIMFIEISARAGLIIGLKRANFNWTNESAPIKQSLNVFIVLFAGWVLNLVLVGGYYFLYKYLEIDQYMIGCIVILGIVDVLLQIWLETKGAEEFSKL